MPVSKNGLEKIEAVPSRLLAGSSVVVRSPSRFFWDQGTLPPQLQTLPSPFTARGEEASPCLWRAWSCQVQVDNYTGDPSSDRVGQRILNSTVQVKIHSGVSPKALLASSWPLCAAIRRRTSPPKSISKMAINFFSLICFFKLIPPLFATTTFSRSGNHDYLVDGPKCCQPIAVCENRRLTSTIIRNILETSW